MSDQRRDPDSLLSFIHLLVRRYRECPELGWTDVEVLEQPRTSVLALRSSVDDAALVTLHNLGADPCTVPLDLPDDAGSRLVDLLQQGETQVDDKGRAEVTLEGYGYRWLRVAHPGHRRLI